ncbi:hypothetical protein [Flavobacterium sp. WC2430]|uniref:hypothetical protein n=1 Tax=Flavobacterium sp. WC2430 TaxID=3234137 RepID=UPI0034662F63
MDLTNKKTATIAVIYIVVSIISLMFILDFMASTDIKSGIVNIILVPICFLGPFIFWGFVFAPYLDDDLIDIKLNGYYIANLIGYNTLNNEPISYDFILMFNHYKMACFINTSDIESEFNDSELKIIYKKFSELRSYKHYEGITKHKINNGKINIRFYESYDTKNIENNIIDENSYFEWDGKIFKDGMSMILTRNDSFLNYDLNQYKIEKSSLNTKFSFKRF